MPFNDTAVNPWVKCNDRDALLVQLCKQQPPYEYLFHDPIEVIVGTSDSATGLKALKSKVDSIGSEGWELISEPAITRFHHEPGIDDYGWQMAAANGSGVLTFRRVKGRA
jgi:hypothetical protein